MESIDIQGEESLGMAMTFTIASAAREALSAVIADRIRHEQEEDDRKAKAYEEVSTEFPLHVLKLISRPKQQGQEGPQSP